MASAQLGQAVHTVPGYVVQSHLTPRYYRRKLGQSEATMGFQAEVLFERMHQKNLVWLRILVGSQEML